MNRKEAKDSLSYRAYNILHAFNVEYSKEIVD